jgi:acetoin:2,6-dichlorophenolindophenol oxidoreductase subunit alpha
LKDRVNGLGVQYVQVDGLDVQQVFQAAQSAIARARNGEGPTFLHTRCVHLEGHFLGLPLLRIIRNPLRELPGIVGPLIQSFLGPGKTSLSQRVAGVKDVYSTIRATLHDPARLSTNDPLSRARAALLVDPDRLINLETNIEIEIATVLVSVINEVVG